MAIYIWKGVFVFDHGKLQLDVDPSKEPVRIELRSGNWRTLYREWALPPGSLEKFISPTYYHYEPRPKPIEGIARLHFGPDESVGENGVSWRILSDFSQFLKDVKDNFDPKYRDTHTVPLSVLITVGYQTFGAGTRWKYGEKGIRMRLA